MKSLTDSEIKEHEVSIGGVEIKLLIFQEVLLCYSEPIYGMDW